MKKLLAFLLTATMLCAMFVLPSAAADNVNFEVEFDYAQKAPVIDGKVGKTEYGALPVHSYPENKSQFVDNEHNQYSESDWDFDFYAVWDADYLYLAWVLNTETHVGIPETDYNGDGVWDSNDYGYIWQYSCVQFIFTPGVPEKGTTSFQTGAYAGDYLEFGLGLSAEGEQIRACWCKPSAALDLEVNDWDAVIVRDDSAKTTTYEVKIPWEKSGLKEKGNGAQFGLTYAVAAQDYNVKPGMIEWQNGMLSTKDADSAAVVTLVGNEEEKKEEIQPSAPSKSEGTVPAAAEGKTQLVIDGVNTAITAEKAYIYTDPSALAAMNTKWSVNVLLAPVEGEDNVYTVQEVVTGAGEDVTFTTEDTTGMIVYAAHSDGEGVGNDRKTAASTLTAGTKVAIFGVDFDAADTLYTNSMLYVVEDATGDTSTEESVEESSEAESVEESSEAESVEESVEASADESTDAPAEEEGGLGVWLWVIIGAVVVVVAVVVVIVVKKKK